MYHTSSISPSNPLGEEKWRDKLTGTEKTDLRFRKRETYRLQRVRASHFVVLQLGKYYYLHRPRLQSGQTSTYTLQVFEK